MRTGSLSTAAQPIVRALAITAAVFAAILAPYVAGGLGWDIAVRPFLEGWAL